MRKIDELIERLPPELQDEVYDFAQFVRQENATKTEKTSYELGRGVKGIS